MSQGIELRKLGTSDPIDTPRPGVSQIGCVFCDIIAGTAPANMLAATPHSVLIRPLSPVVDGHVLVIPRAHVMDAGHHPAVAAATMHDAAAYAAHPSARSTSSPLRVPQPRLIAACISSASALAAW